MFGEFRAAQRWLFGQTNGAAVVGERYKFSMLWVWLLFVASADAGNPLVQAGNMPVDAKPGAPVWASICRDFLAIFLRKYSSPDTITSKPDTNTRVRANASNAARVGAHDLRKTGIIQHKRWEENKRAS